MNSHLKKIFIYLGAIGTQAKLWYLEQKPWMRILIAVLVLAVLIISIKALSSDKVSETSDISKRKVKVASIGSLSNGQNNLPLIGTVSSVSEATIRSESSGKLTRVYKRLGDSVVAGSVIAEFENSAERAAVLQAEGAYDQAKASRDITALNSGQAGSSLTESKSQAYNTLSSTYSTMDDAVRGKSDMAYSEPAFEEVKLILTVPDANFVSSLESKRRVVGQILKNREARNKIVSLNSDLISELNTLQTETQTIKNYLDDLYSAYSKAIPDSQHSQSTLDAEKASVQVARSSIGGAISSIVSVRSALSAAITASQVAGNGTVNSGTLATADAQVKQALGAYNAALSRLEKTVIRSPISGTINSLSIQTGDYVTAFSQIAIVSNNGALEIISMVTENDAKRIVVGSPVTINNTISGVVTRVAPAIDPTTNKVEVRVGIRDTKSNLVNGQSVQVSISSKNAVATDRTSGPIVIPISSLKLTPNGANVFIVGTSSELISLPVKEGAILGDQIQILSGLRGDEIIVVDARGLKEGMEVVVSE